MTEEKGTVWMGSENETRERGEKTRRRGGEDKSVVDCSERRGDDEVEDRLCWARKIETKVAALCGPILTPSCHTHTHTH